jgi:hypothetical protein
VNPGDVNEQAIERAEPEQLPSIAGELARLTALVQLRITSPRDLSRPIVPPEPDGPVLVDTETAAKITGLSPVQLRRSPKFKHAKRTLGHRSLMWDRAALLRAARRAS